MCITKNIKRIISYIDYISLRIHIIQVCPYTDHTSIGINTRGVCLYIDQTRIYRYKLDEYIHTHIRYVY